MGKHRKTRSKASISAQLKWDNAKEKQRVFKSLTGEQLSSKEFVRKDNPLDNRIVVYDVSAQANYDSVNGGIYTSGKTFQVIMFRDFSDTDNITNKTKSAFSSMKYAGDSFHTGLQSAIEQNTNVDIKEVRGLEEVRNKHLTKTDYSKLVEGGSIVKGLDSDIKFTKNKKGRKLGNYTAQLDLEDF